MKMSNRMYDVLKWVALIALPAFGTLYATVGAVWGLPFVEEIKTTCLALGVFIGTCIGVSTNAYYKEQDAE